MPSLKRSAELAVPEATRTGATCTYMCPWPRIQGAMTDSHTLLVGYKSERGEPRGPTRKGQDGHIDWSNRGDCIDCKACVVVCPAGIDIRDGSQLECIQCALCIDACNDIMDKIGRPRGLIGYDTVARQDAKGVGAHEPLRLVRARTLLYAGLFTLVGAIMLLAWHNRTVLEVNVLPDRIPPYVLLSDGSVRNTYTVKILNKLHEPRSFTLAVSGQPNAQLTVLGSTGTALPVVSVRTDELRELRVFVTLPSDVVQALPSSPAPLTLVVSDQGSDRHASRTSLFQAPVSRRP